MQVLQGWWAGARRHGSGLDLASLAEEVGGWDALISGGTEPLVHGGVPARKAREWVAHDDERTLGVPLTLADRRYPSALRKMRTPPPVVCVEGDLEALEGTAVGIVGTRACTRYGRGVARHLAGALATEGVVVVSGLARGIDAEAHEAALAVGRTVAVLGHGLAHTAPATHRGLRRRILEAGGAMVSAWSDDTPPRPYTFPARNQWIAGLSTGVVVVEAPRRSGALITARAASVEGREVFAVPGPLGAKASVGCLELLSDGAQVVVEVESFVSHFVQGQVGAWEDWLSELFLGSTVSQVARRHNRPVPELMTRLTQLELRGRVVRLPGQRYAPGRR